MTPFHWRPRARVYFLLFTACFIVCPNDNLLEPTRHQRKLLNLINLVRISCFRQLYSYFTDTGNRLSIRHYNNIIHTIVCTLHTHTHTRARDFTRRIFAAECNNILNVLYKTVYRYIYIYIYGVSALDLLVSSVKFSATDESIETIENQQLRSSNLNCSIE